MGWTQPQKEICANYMYQLAIGPGCRGSLGEFENKTLYELQELNDTQNTQTILSDNMELQVTTVSCQSYDRSKSYNFVFHHVCFFS